MLKPSRLSSYVALATCATALWLWTTPPSSSGEAFASGRLRIENVQLVDPQSGALRAGMQIVIEDGRIRKISQAAQGSGPQLDAQGLSALPGLVETASFASLDASLPEERLAPDVREAWRRQLQAGVTTAFNLNSSRAQIRRLAAEPLPLELPRLRLAAALITAPGGWRPGTAGDGASPAIEVSDVEGLERAFQSCRDDGARLIVASVEHSAREEAALSPQVLERLGELCRMAGLPLIVHAAHASKALAALEARPNLIVGPWGDEPAAPALVAAMLASHCTWAPALQSLMGLKDQEGLPEALLLSPGWPNYALQSAGAAPALAAQNVGLLARAGVPIALGSLSGMPGLPHGFAARAELSRLRQAGLSQSALLAAMGGAAGDALGEPSLGRLGEGGAADLILVSGDPLGDFKVAYVVRAGHVWSADELAKP